MRRAAWLLLPCLSCSLLVRAVDTCEDGVPDPGELCLEEGAPLPLALGATALAVGDFDGDGAPDLALTLASNEEHLRVLRNDGAGGFSDSFGVVIQGRGPAAALVAADFDGDGTDEIYASFPDVDALTGFRLDPALGLILDGPDLPFSGATSLLALDLDRDGDLDLLGNEGPGLRIARNQAGALSHKQGDEILLGGSDLTVLAPGDLNHDGLPDLVAADNEDNLCPILLDPAQLPGGALVGAPFPLGDIASLISVLEASTGPRVLVVGRRLQFIDVLVGTEGDLIGSVSSPLGLGAVGGMLPVNLDLDLANEPDLVMTLPQQGGIGLFGGTSAGLSAPAILRVEGTPQAVVAADLNRDTVPDLAFVDSNTQEIRFLFSQP